MRRTTAWRAGIGGFFEALGLGLAGSVVAGVLSWWGPPPLSARLSAMFGSAAFWGGLFLLVLGAWLASPGGRARVVGRIGGMVLLVTAALASWTFLSAFDLSSPVPRLKPSQTLVLDRVSPRRRLTIHTNEAGYRDLSWADRAPGRVPGPRILLAGDSVTFGVGIPDDAQTMPRVLERELRTTLPGGEANVFSVALSGLDFSQEVELVAAAAPVVRPNLVIVAHWELNDLSPPLPHFRSPVAALALLPGMLAWQDALVKWEQLPEAHGAEGSPTRATFAADLGRLRALADSQGFDVLFAQLVGSCPPAYGERLSGDRARIEAVRIGNGALPPYRDPQDPKVTLTLSPNDGHPSPAGVERYVARLAPAAAAMLRARAGGPPPGLTTAYEAACASWKRPPTRR